ncbi:hypothetical protein KIW84_054720 [Lathyrus oleraceus]|uniref:Uncharacterized protein n=1 Tax=Pisum sativum TaxID=3888 RepID=A0A9D4WWD9_PEA|nr:hypothetical protein KIW84_054720 [Pisum sativum]
MISNYINKDMSSLLEKIIKKEISSIGTTITRSLSQNIEKAITTFVMESFQKGVGDKALNQLEKSVCSKLEATVARQIQVQFQTTGKNTINSASSITQTLSGQLADGQRKLLEMAANSKVAADPFVTQVNNGLHEITKDPTKELSRSECNLSISCAYFMAEIVVSIQKSSYSYRLPADDVLSGDIAMIRCRVYVVTRTVTLTAAH